MSHSLIASNPFSEIYEQYAEDAAFFWILRNNIMHQPHYLPSDVKELEHRIHNQIQGLYTAPDLAWEICKDALRFEQGGEAFTATFVAFHSEDPQKIQVVIESAAINENMFKGVVSALSWFAPNIALPWIRKLLKSKDIEHKYLALTYISQTRTQPGQYLATLLKREDCQQHSRLYARCLRLIGELKLHDLAPFLHQAHANDNEDVRFWAAWSQVMLGDKTALDTLAGFTQNTAYQNTASDVLVRAADAPQSKRFISQLAKDPASHRQAIKACAALGDPQSIDWLIGIMAQTPLAKLAGEAFEHITGIHIEHHNLHIDADAVESLGLENIDDEDLALDEDENLLWPNVEKIKAVWQQQRHQYTQGQRYFYGAALSQASLEKHIQNSTQRRRHWAATELALMNKTLPLKNTKAKQL